MAIDTLDKTISAMANKKQIIPLEIASGTTVAAYNYLINRLIANSTFGQMAIPTAFGSGGNIPNSNMLGYPNLVSATNPDSLYLSRATLFSSIACYITLFDTLYACSGFSGTSASLQTIVNPPALTRNVSGIGNQIFLVCYTATGSTGVTATVKYTNTDGTSGRTGTVAIPASNPAGRVLQVALQTGDLGVLSIQSVQLSATTGTAGNFGLSIMEPLTSIIPISTANTVNSLNFLDLSLPSLENGCALSLVCLATGTSSGNIRGSIEVIRG